MRRFYEQTLCILHKFLLANQDLHHGLLAALDQIKAMLDEAAGGGEANRAVSAEILLKVRQLTGKPEPRPAEAAPSPELAPAADARGPVLDWHIRFSPGADLLRTGTNPLLLLRELKQLGSLQIKASMAAVPPIGELDPERCYISWDMVLTTSAAREAISDVFIFVADCCELTIEAAIEQKIEAKIELTTEPAIEMRIKPAIEPASGPVSGQVSSAAVAEPQAPKPKFPSYGRRASDTPDNASSIRVPAAKLDQFVNLVGELVTVQARLFEIATRREDPEVVAVSEEVDRLTSALRESSISIRMLPIRATFERFRRLVHDLARDLHKEVELTIEGADTELDKSVIDQLNDPLMHLIRNSMDHGIEPPEKRLAALPSTFRRGTRVRAFLSRWRTTGVGSMRRPSANAPSRKGWWPRTQSLRKPRSLPSYWRRAFPRRGR